ncbi:helix-turn-helix transcriptional regulator [Vibrio scophthalmi]|uniref:helix-turn-helix domain-containing protein n=1 Tax=Vibrio scophthalmi TaxID=45658 RepID=UPI002FEFC32B
MPKTKQHSYLLNQYFTQLRLARGHKQTEVSNATGIKHRTYQRIEQQEKVIDAHQIQLLCDFYHITLVDMAQGTLRLSSASDAELLTLLRILPAPVKESIRDLLVAITRR